MIHRLVSEIEESPQEDCSPQKKKLETIVESKIHKKNRESTSRT